MKKNVSLPFIIFSLCASLAYIIYIDSRPVKKLSTIDHSDDEMSLKMSVTEALSQDEKILKKVLRKVASETTINELDTRTGEEMKVAELGQLSDSVESDNSPLISLTNEYNIYQKELNPQQALRQIQEKAKEKNILFTLKNDILSNPKKYHLSESEVYQMVTEDLQNFPKKLELPFVFDKVYTKEEKAFFEEADSQDDYLIAAYELYLEKNNDDALVINQMTTHLVTDLLQKDNKVYADKIVESKNNFESSTSQNSEQGIGNE